MRASDGLAGAGDGDSPPKAESGSSGEGGSRPPATPAKFGLVFFADLSEPNDLGCLAMLPRCGGV
jgi:hypothetical protein